MRRLGLIFFFLLCVRAHAALSVVQVVSNTASNSTTVNATLTSTTAGNLIVVSSWWDNTGRTFTSVTDNKSNAYSNANSTAGSTTQAERIDFAKNATGAVTTVTLTISGGANVAIVVYEIAGADQINPLDTTAVGNSTSATSVAASITTAATNDIIISGFCNGDTSADTAHDAGMTVDKDLNATAGGRFGAGHHIVSSVQTALDVGWTTAGAATAWAIVGASFRAATTVSFVQGASQNDNNTVGTTSTLAFASNT